jgi:hypothetical protein
MNDGHNAITASYLYDFHHWCCISSDITIITFVDQNSRSAFCINSLAEFSARFFSISSAVSSASDIIRQYDSTVMTDDSMTIIIQLSMMVARARRSFV